MQFSSTGLTVANRSYKPRHTAIAVTLGNNRRFTEHHMPHRENSPGRRLAFDSCGYRHGHSCWQPGGKPNNELHLSCRDQFTANWKHRQPHKHPHRPNHASPHHEHSPSHHTTKKAPDRTPRPTSIPPDGLQ